MGCRKKNVGVQEDIAYNFFFSGPCGTVMGIGLGHWYEAASSCSFIPSCATPKNVFYSKNTLF